MQQSTEWPRERRRRPVESSGKGWCKPADKENISYLKGYGDGGYGDTLAKTQVWTSINARSVDFSGPGAGRYTRHARSVGGRYEANMTFLVQASSTSGKPGEEH